MMISGNQVATYGADFSKQDLKISIASMVKAPLPRAMEKSSSKAAERKSLCSVLKEVGGESSMHGVPKIMSAKHAVVRVLWIMLLMGTFSLFVYQTLGIFDDYFSYSTRITVKTQSGSVAFPSITICNINPIKKTKLSTLTDSTLSSIYSLAEELFNTLDVTTVLTDLVSDVTDLLSDTLNPGSLLPGLGIPLFRRKRDTSGNSTLLSVKLKFFEELDKLTNDQRLGIGHQLSDMLVSGLANGNGLPLSGYKQLLSAVYGNCFTLESDGLSSLTGGATTALNFLLSAETTEYLTSFVPTFGMQLMLHEKGTFPMPDQNGISLGTAFETDIKISMSEIHRYGKDLGRCTDGKEFGKIYGVAYSEALCYSLCETNKILEECHCLTGVFKNFTGVNACVCDPGNETVQTCVKGVREAIQEGATSCNCQPPCHQKVFTAKASGRPWPHDLYIKNVLLPESCRRNMSLVDGLCLSLSSNTSISLSTDQLLSIAKNFLSVNIHYDDVTYEVISEEPFYDTLQFLCDIGGAMGFYLGASVLTYLELIQVLVEVCLHCRRRRGCVTPSQDKVSQFK